MTDNQERLDELTDRMSAHHFNHGLGVNMSNWRCVSRRRYDVILDGELVGVQENSYIDFYPVGKIECGNCECMKEINEHKCAYFHYNNDYMICYDCNQMLKHNIQPAFPPMWCRVFGVADFTSYDKVEIIERFPTGKKARKRYELAVRKANNIAARSGKHFMGGMCTIDVWHMLLSKRVLRKFRALVQRRLQEKLAMVLYYKCPGINLHAAQDIAQHGVNI